MLMSELGPWGALAGGAMNLIGGILGNRAANQQRGQALGYAYNNALPYLQGMGIPNPQIYLNPASSTLNTFGTQTIDNMGQWLPDYLAQLRNELPAYGSYGIPTLGRPTDMGSFYNSPWADVGRTYDGLTQMGAGQMGNILSGYGGMNDLLMAYLSGQNGPMATLGEVGQDLLTGRGNTGYNLNAQDAAGRAISGGGWDPRFAGLYDSGNSLFSAGGMTPNLNSAFQTAQSGIGSYGMTPGLAGLQQYVMSGLGGGPLTSGMSSLNQIATQGLPAYMTGPTSQLSQLGGYGQSAANRLLSGNGFAPSLPNGVSPYNIQSALAQIQGLGGDSGYTAQNLGFGGQGYQGLSNLLGREGNIDDLINTAHQAFTGKLPGGTSADQFGNMLQGIIGQFGGGGGVGGGMASGASAGGMLPMDPTLEAMLKQGAEYFKNNPLMSREQMISFARDAAATSAAQQAEAAQRFALARGGGGAVINAGQQNQAMADFYDKAMQAEAAAVRDAALRHQELGLQQQMQGAQIGLGASNADTARQQVAASRDIASANNATSASIASANNSTQAGIANAQLRNAALQAAAQAAVQARGQEYGQSQSGLNALVQAQQIANQRGGIFEDAAKSALSDATQRYAIGAGALNNLAPIMNANANQIQALGNYQNQYDANRNSALNSVLGGALTASNNATGSNNQMAQILAQLGVNVQGLGNQRELGLLSAGNTGNATATNNLGNFMQLLQGTNSLGSSNIGQGLSAMQGAGGLANNALGIYGNIGNQASADQLARMGLGGNLLQQNLGATGNFGQLLNSGLTNMNSAYGNMLNSTGNLLGQQGNLWQNMFGMDFNNRQLQGNLSNNYWQNMLGLGNLGNTYAQTGMTPLLNTVDNAWRYAGQSLNPYSSIVGATLGAQSPQQRPWPQMQTGNGQQLNFPTSSGGGGNNSTQLGFGGGYIMPTNYPITTPTFAGGYPDLNWNFSSGYAIPNQTPYVTSGVSNYTNFNDWFANNWIG